MNVTINMTIETFDLDGIVEALGIAITRLEETSPYYDPELARLQLLRAELIYQKVQQRRQARNTAPDRG